MADESKSGKTIRLPPPFVQAFESEYERLLKAGVWTDRGATAAAALILWLASPPAVQKAASQATPTFGSDHAEAIDMVRAALLKAAAKGAMQSAKPPHSEALPAPTKKASGAR